MSPRIVAIVLALVFLLALLLRGAGFEWVLVDPETVVFPPGDAQYHLRRALYGWVNFPEILFFDPYINFPGGAAVPWPPLFDFALSALGRLLTRDAHVFQVVAAWVPPLLGAATVFPVFAIGRLLGGPSLGLGGAALLALFPMSVVYSRIGQVDHHCAVAFIGACLLWVVVRLVDAERATLALGVGLLAGRVAMLLTWHGSLLYLALVEGTLWLAAGLASRRDLYAVQALSAVATVAVVGPLVWLLPEPLGGAWSAVALSRLQVTAVAAVALVSGCLLLLDARGLARSARARIAWTLGLGLFVVVALWATPAIRSGVEPALRFMTMRDGVGARTGEQLPLFAVFGRETGRPAWQAWGLFAYALPFLPFALVPALSKERRRAALVLAAWCVWFGGLALVQRRYGNDLGPAAAVGFASIIAAVARRLAGWLARPAVAVPLGLLLALLLLWPPISGDWTRRVSRSGVALLRVGASGDSALLAPAGSLTRFLERVRLLTPRTEGYLDTTREPAYGIVAQPNFGHAIQNVARRPTPTDPFWAFIGQGNWHLAQGLLSAGAESEALAFADSLRARYVMTSSGADPAAVEGWLHHYDGRSSDAFPATTRFRLVSEGPRGGAHLAKAFRRARGNAKRRLPAPYKLFEIVEGALIEVAASPGSEVVVSLRLHTPIGRRFNWESRAVASVDGVAHIRVPYSTRSGRRSVRVQALGPYRVHFDGRSTALAVSEADVVGGARLVVGAPNS